VSHRNAPLTPRGRLLLCQRIEAGSPVAHVAGAMGVSRQCAHKWWRRYQELGADGLFDRSSRPHRSPSQTSRRLEAKIVRRRRSTRRDRIGSARLSGWRPRPSTEC
jgi:transposase-like protein